MPPLVLVPLVGLAAGFAGTLLGIGGGVIMVPVLSLLGFDVKYVVPASLVAIVGTSLGGLRYLAGRRLVDYKLAVVLESASVSGAILGSLVFTRLSSSLLLAIFGAVLVAMGFLFIARERLEEQEGVPAEGFRFRFSGHLGRLAAGLGASFAAGLLSSLLGIGGGVVKVPVLVLVLGLPVHAAMATSKLMVGITALAAVIGHAATGYMDWRLALLLAAGTFTGATVSARLLTRLHARVLYFVAAGYYFAMGAYLLATRLG